MDFVQVLTSAPRRRPERPGVRGRDPARSVILRVGLLLLLAVVLQISGLSQMGMLGGARPTCCRSWLPPSRLLLRQRPGRAPGFFTGVLVDLALGTNWARRRWC